MAIDNSKYTINIEFLLGVLAERALALDSIDRFTNEAHQYFHDGQVSELNSFSAFVKTKIYKSPYTPPSNPANVVDSGDLAYYLIDLNVLVCEINCRKNALNAQTNFVNPNQKAFHDGQLAELNSISSLVMSSIYKD